MGENYPIIDSEDIKLKRWRESTKSLLGSVDTSFFQPYSISIVPDELRKWNEDAYMPKVVSIGHRYKGTRRDLLQMEEIKWRCMMSLLLRTDDPAKSLDICSEAILELDGAVRASYVDEINLDRYNLATIMLYDSCFLLELLISGSKEWDVRLESRLKPPGPGAEVGKMEEVLTDLTLLENQIPLFILHKLFLLLFCQSNEYIVDKMVANDLKKLAVFLFGYSPVSSFNSTPAHFLELAHSSILGESEKLHENLGDREKLKENQESQHLSIIEKNGKEIEQCRHVELNRCATRLLAAGITIKPPESEPTLPLRRKGIERLLSTQGFRRRAERKNVDDPAVISSFNFDIRFSNSNNSRKLVIPPLHITKTTEAMWRNFIAWEHHKMKVKSSSIASAREQGTTGFSCKCTSSALLFNGLICSAADVQLLKDRKVIVDHLNMSNPDLVAFFRSITMGVDRGIIDSSYSEMFYALNTCSATNYATLIPIILWHYLRRIPELFYSLNKFLRRGYNFAAAIISVLTVVQTIYAVLSYHYPKK